MKQASIHIPAPNLTGWATLAKAIPLSEPQLSNL
jgi:hypothetical protein